MAVRNTVQVGDPLLRAHCTEIADPGAPEVRALAEDLRDTLSDWVDRTGYGRGIAAPQIGHSVRLVHVRLGEDPVLVNPAITARGEPAWEPWETCLSLSVGLFGRVPRSAWVEVSYLTPDGSARRLRAEGDLAHLLQHEIDHLDRVLTVDRMRRDTMCTRGEFEGRHRADSPYRS